MNRFRSRLILLTLFGVVSFAAARPSSGLASTKQLLKDPSFESLSTGTLATTGIIPGWEVQRTGRAAIQEKLMVSCSSDPTLAKSGQNCVSLSIPEEMVGFEFVTVGQRITLVAGKEYPGAWKLYVQLNGWGNFGSGVTVSCDDLECIAKNPQRQLTISRME
jgi:hypothetical protein